MLNIQKKYVSYLTEINKELSVLKEDSSVQKRCSEIDDLKQEVKEKELLVPVIGAFSTGKTTLINSFLKETLLPVGITPETSLATELRYSNRRYLETVDQNNAVSKHELSDIEKIKDHAGNYKLVRVYLDSPTLKEIEPLILVDMPGFDSPLDLHNQAIFSYLNKGSQFIVLTSIEDGSITKSMLRQLASIQEFKRDFSFFLSKANLRADSEVEEVKEEIKEQLNVELGITKEIQSLGLDQGELLQKVVSEIDPEGLFEKLFSERIKELTFKILGTLNTAVSVLKKDKNENEQQIKELKQGIENIVAKKESLVKDTKNEYSDHNVELIINCVGRKLSSSIDELTQSYLNGGSEALSQNMTDLVKTTLVIETKEAVSDIREEVIEHFSSEISILSNFNAEYNMNEDIMTKMTNSTKEVLGSASTFLTETVAQRKKNNTANVSYKVMTSIFAATTAVVFSAVEQIIVFLPEILSGIFDRLNKGKKEEEVRQKIMTEMIPQVKRQLKNDLPTVFNEQVKNLINEISNSFENELVIKKQQVAELEAAKDSQIKTNNEKIEMYQQVNEQIKKLATETIFKGENE